MLGRSSAVLSAIIRLRVSGTKDLSFSITVWARRLTTSPNGYLYSGHWCGETSLFFDEAGAFLVFHFGCNSHDVPDFLIKLHIYPPTTEN